MYFQFFDVLVYKLRQDGTYAGNDAIVAFARKNGINVVIHQLNAPMWTVSSLVMLCVPCWYCLSILCMNA